MTKFPLMTVMARYGIDKSNFVKYTCIYVYLEIKDNFKIKKELVEAYEGIYV